MKKLCYLLFLIGATVLVSFRGGAIAYFLFYFALFLPVLAFLYSLYVYCRFRIVQEVSRTVTKGAAIPYRLKLANEDPLPFLNLHLNFFEDMVHMDTISFSTQEQGSSNRLCLLPHENLLVDTKMYCMYRGTCPIGVKSVSVTDFLNLFTITYPLPSTVRLTARPRILSLEQLRVSLPDEDSKIQLLSYAKLQELPDFELRSYQPGDSLKYIHWKNSAKTGELLVRKLLPEELLETVIFMDFTPFKGEESLRLQKEDNIIEAGLAFIYDSYLKKIPVKIVYAQNKSIIETYVDVLTGFDSFYQACATLPFESSLSLYDLFYDYTRTAAGGQALILITVSASPALLSLAEERRKSGNEVVLLQTGDLPL